tara:strand:- start:108 stop:296 length:189 start_codon:yes stop_codon:yes gene_type:complete
MHQKIQKDNLFSYWIVKVYDPSVDMFTDAFKSYGLNVANEKLIEFLKAGNCAIIKHEKLPII